MRRTLVFPVLLALASNAAAFNDQHANELVMMTLQTSNIVTKASIGQLLFEGLLRPQPGKLADIVEGQGGLRAKAAWLYLKTAKVVPADFGTDTISAPAGEKTRICAKATYPDDIDPTAVSAYVTGWGLHFGPVPSTHLTGNGTLRTVTGIQGDAMIVMRGPKVDIAYGGDENRIMGRRFTPLQKSRLELTPGEKCLEFLYPYTGTTEWGFPNLVGPKQTKLVRKTPGKAKFVYFAENSPNLQKTLMDPAQPTGRVEVVGDWNNWNTDANSGTVMELFDDGGFVEESSQDAVVGDAVYSRVLTLPRGTHGYAFIVNGAPNLQRDPYEEGSKEVEIKTQLGKFKLRVSTITVE